ncbi:glycosyltransferase family 4 protein [Klebsiella pneumoniae]|uniref:glycosyltransferase family 4 protein n=1 Tax=Klebsiella pneumoniae TaxID=573 RepID=UPI0028B8AE43|nr:glycosyltransferase family 4 protein [Klebsiella pneumoniae]
MLIVFHEYGEPSHYLGLSLLNKSDKVIYREFSTLRLVYKAFKKRDFRILIKAINDFFYILFCFIFPSILKDKRIVIGIAPLDYRVIIFNRILKYACVIYHTSWSDWSGEFYPKKNNHYKNTIIESWRFFLNYRVRHIAAVTEYVKISISLYWEVPQDKISVVYHAYDGGIFNLENSLLSEKRRNIVFVGRLIESKGLRTILDIAKVNPHYNFIIAGNGNLVSLIKSVGLPNVKYVGYIASKEYLARIFKESRYILLPSIRSHNWEELFGMVIPEAMACGCIPICTNHSGPKIILNNTPLEKYIFNENEYEIHTNKILGSTNSINSNFESQEAVNISKKYEANKIASIWEGILAKSTSTNSWRRK